MWIVVIVAVAGSAYAVVHIEGARVAVPSCFPFHCVAHTCKATMFEVRLTTSSASRMCCTVPLPVLSLSLFESETKEKRVTKPVPHHGAKTARHLSLILFSLLSPLFSFLFLFLSFSLSLSFTPFLPFSC